MKLYSKIRQRPDGSYGGHLLRTGWAIDFQSFWKTPKTWSHSSRNHDVLGFLTETILWAKERSPTDVVHIHLRPLRRVSEKIVSRESGRECLGKLETWQLRTQLSCRGAHHVSRHCCIFSNKDSRCKPKYCMFNKSCMSFSLAVYCLTVCLSCLSLYCPKGLQHFGKHPSPWEDMSLWAKKLLTSQSLWWMTDTAIFDWIYYIM